MLKCQQRRMQSPIVRSSQRPKALRNTLIMDMQESMKRSLQVAAYLPRQNCLGGPLIIMRAAVWLSRKKIRGKEGLMCVIFDGWKRPRL